MANPEITDKDGKIQAKYSVWYDGDLDGKSSGSVAIVLELDKVEAIKELANAVVKSEKAPQWLKDLLKSFLPEPTPPAA